MLGKLLLYPHGFQRYELYNVILLGNTISRKKHAKFIATNRNSYKQVYSTLNLWEFLNLYFVFFQIIFIVL